jgi:transcriptional regulator with XRE-family HTH domain
MRKKIEEIRQILALNIKKRREYLGISQEKLAEITDLSVQTINTIEGCRMWISDKTITRLATALDVEIYQLFVPYQLNQDELKASSSTILLELRQKLKEDVENLNSQLDIEFDRALKSNSQLPGIR